MSGTMTYQSFLEEHGSGVAVSYSITKSSSCIGSAHIAGAHYACHGQDGMCTGMAVSRRASEGRAPTTKPMGTYAHVRHRPT